MPTAGTDGRQGVGAAAKTVAEHASALVRLELELAAMELKRKVWPLIEAGKVKPVIHATFALKDAAEAHRVMEADAHIGKLVLTTA